MSNKMAEYQIQFKENIKKLVNQNRLAEAKELITQYEGIVQDDIDLYSIKGVIAMMEGDLDRAEKILDKGILKDSHEDLLYNIAYLYKMMGKVGRAIYFYKRLYHQTNDVKVKGETERELQNLNADTRLRILIGSPIHQNPRILREFLLSLKALNRKNLKISYYFVDDNIDEESSKIIREFAKVNNSVIVERSGHRDQYIRNDNTHIWKEHLIWKVANFKNNIINYARDNNFDYLFLVDSDLILHPNTLQHLLSTRQEIISEIFWTKWKQDSIKLPQVWMQDVYTQHEISRGERLNAEEVNRRHMEFLNKLKKPGVYEVGGLGACTLISKYAMDKGVDFSEIKNLSFAGEDRHFCIRAVALGLKLYVDTHYPAYHIYRESDLLGVSDYKKGVSAKKK